MKTHVLIPWRRHKLPVALPDEVLLVVFEAILASNNTLSTYELLLAATRTNRQWRRVSIEVLLRHVELVKQEDAKAFHATLQNNDGRGDLVRSMAICSHLCGDVKWRDIISKYTLFDVLALTPHLRQLTLLHVDSGDDLEKDNPSLDKLSALSHLEDVTIVPAKPDLSSLARLVIIGNLPSQVKHLQLPGPSPSEPVEFQPHPTFQLTSLHIQVYPTPWTNWLLHHCSTSLQALAVATLQDIQHLAGCHPNLTSLTVLGRLAPHPEGLALLKNLQHLDLASDLAELPLGILRTLPESLRRLQIRCTKLGAILGQHLYRLPFLNTIVWHLPRCTIRSQEIEDGVGDLRRACEARSIKLVLVGWVRKLSTCYILS